MGLTIHSARIRINLGHAPGEDNPNRTNKGHNNNNSNRGHNTTPPMCRALHTTMSKYQWTCHTLEPRTTNTNIEATTPTLTQSTCKRHMAMQRTLKIRPTNANTLRDPASTAERWDTSPRIVAATHQATSITWTLKTKTCETFHSQTSHHELTSDTLKPKLTHCPKQTTTPSSMLWDRCRILPLLN